MGSPSLACSSVSFYVGCCNYSFRMMKKFAIKHGRFHVNIVGIHCASWSGLTRSWSWQGCRLRMYNGRRKGHVDIDCIIILFFKSKNIRTPNVSSSVFNTTKNVIR